MSSCVILSVFLFRTRRVTFFKLRLRLVAVTRGRRLRSRWGIKLFQIYLVLLFNTKYLQFLTIQTHPTRLTTEVNNRMTHFIFQIFYVKSHGSLFYFHDFCFLDCFIFTVADWSIVKLKKVSHDFLHTVK